MTRKRRWGGALLATVIIGVGCTPGPGDPALTTPFDTTKLAAPVVVVFQRHVHTSGSGGPVETYAARPALGTSAATAVESDQAQEFASRLGYRVVDNTLTNTLATTTASGVLLATLVDPLFPIPSSTPSGYWIYGLRWSPDGAKVAITRLFEILAGGFVANTTIYEAVTGARLGSTVDGREFAWKYDSTGVAFGAGSAVRTMALTPGATPVTVEAVAPGDCAQPRDWSVGERLLFMCQVGPEPMVRTLATMPASGGPRRLLDSGTAGSTPGWIVEAPSSARFVPGSTQIIFNRPSSVASLYSLLPVTGQALEAIDDAPGASPIPLTVVSPSLVQSQVFTTEDVIVGFVT